MRGGLRYYSLPCWRHQRGAPAKKRKPPWRLGLKKLPKARKEALIRQDHVINQIIAQARKGSALDVDTGEDLAKKVREYHVPNFTNWKDHDAFEAAFGKLMADLRAEVK